MGCLVLVGILERPEELLVALDILAAVHLYSSVHRAFWAFVGERLGETRERWLINVLHGVRAEGRGNRCLFRPG